MSEVSWKQISNLNKVTTVKKNKKKKKKKKKKEIKKKERKRNAKMLFFSRAPDVFLMSSHI